jgi:hypothetical protein
LSVLPPAVFFEVLPLGLGAVLFLLLLCVGLRYLYRFIMRRPVVTAPSPLEEYLSLTERLEQARGQPAATQESMRATVGFDPIFDDTTSSESAKDRRARYLLDLAFQHQTLTPLDQEELDRILPSILERIRGFVATYGRESLSPSIVLMLKKAAVYIKVIRPALRAKA